jgi:hypothetical protein
VQILYKLWLQILLQIICLNIKIILKINIIINLGKFIHNNHNINYNNKYQIAMKIMIITNNNIKMRIKINV